MSEIAAHRFDTFPAGALLYRGIDCRPEKAQAILRLNSMEEVLWLAPDSISAQTYIPDFDGASGYPVPQEYELDQMPRPDDGINDALIHACGGEFTVERREHTLTKEQANNPRCEIPKNRITNGTWGRPTSWMCPAKKRVTNRMILTYLKGLGYDTAQHYLWLKTKYVDNKTVVFRANARLRGTLAIIRVRETICGIDASTGDSSCLDPDYHRAARWAQSAAADGKDFVCIDDLAQTKLWGNIGHRSLAINSVGLQKLELIALLPAYHREWDAELSDQPTIEERAWRRGLIHSLPLARQ